MSKKKDLKNVLYKIVVPSYIETTGSVTAFDPNT